MSRRFIEYTDNMATENPTCLRYIIRNEEGNPLRIRHLIRLYPLLKSAQVELSKEPKPQQDLFDKGKSGYNCDACGVDLALGGAHAVHCC